MIRRISPAKFSLQHPARGWIYGAAIEHPVDVISIGFSSKPMEGCGMGATKSVIKNACPQGSVGIFPGKYLMAWAFRYGIEITEEHYRHLPGQRYDSIQDDPRGIGLNDGIEIKMRIDANNTVITALKHADRTLSRPFAVKKTARDIRGGA